MPAVCLYFHIHQAHRLRRYSVFDSAPTYFNEDSTIACVRTAAADSYIPACQLLRDLQKKHRHHFRFALSISGTATELLHQHAPDALHALQFLVRTGNVECLGQPSAHSLAILYSRAEFKAQVDLHRRLMEKYFHQLPKVFRNTGLIANNDVAALVHSLGFTGMLAQAYEPVLQSRSSAFLYLAPTAPITLLLRNASLSDAIPLQFGGDAQPPVNAATLVDSINAIGGHVVNIDIDMETFGLTHSAPTGVFTLLHDLIDALRKQNVEFLTPSDCLSRFPTTGHLDMPRMVSSDPGAGNFDLSGWLGNAMQTNAVTELFNLEAPILHRNNPRLLNDFRKLSAADHPWAMSTRHVYPESHPRHCGFDSPYDVYIHFMNVLDHIRSRLRA